MAEGMNHSVLIRDAWKTYDGERFVLKGVDMEVAPKSMVLIQGRSGSGKTTLLNLIGCIETPTRGEVWLNGQDVAKLSPRELAAVRLSKIGIVFQSHNLIDELTIGENVHLPLKIARNREGGRRVEELLGAFDIADLGDKRPSEVSGGEKQRAAIARALANNPTILLADEPTASLDLDNSSIVIDAFKKVNDLFDTTVIIATHDPIIIGHVDRVYQLERGHLEAVQ